MNALGHGNRLDEAIAGARADRARLDSSAVGLVPLILLGLSNVVGTGIFVVTGSAAADFAGAAVVLSFAIAGIVALLTAIAYAELAAMIPIAGSTYSYALAAFGPLVAWLVGWTLIVEYLFAGATVASGWSGYALNLVRGFGLDVPTMLTRAPIGDDPGLANVPAASIALVVGLLVFAGTRESVRLNGVLALLKISALLLVVAVGIAAVDPANWMPFIPAGDGEFGMYGWSGILRAAGLVFFAYLGFDAVSTAAAETRNPQRTVPIALIAIVGFAIILYSAVALVITGLVQYMDLAVPDPIARALEAAGGYGWVLRLLDVVAVIGLTGGVLVSIFGQSRIFFRMGEDGMLPGRFASVGRHRTPGFATLISTATIAVLAGLVPIGILVELASVGTLVAFCLIGVTVLYLRVTRPDVERPFRVPAVWVLCPAMIIGAASLIALLPIQTWVRYVVWVTIGLILWFAFVRSRLAARRLVAGTEHE